MAGCSRAASSTPCSPVPARAGSMRTSTPCSCTTPVDPCGTERTMASTRVALRTRQLYRLAAKEWRLLARNPHGLAGRFLMPAIFVLIMSLTMKNALVDRPPLPSTAWVLEDASAPAGQRGGPGQAQHPSRTYDSVAALEQAVAARQVEAGVRVMPGWLGEGGRPRADRVEIWLGNRIQPAAAAR